MSRLRNVGRLNFSSDVLVSELGWIWTEDDGDPAVIPREMMPLEAASYITPSLYY